MNTSNVNPTTPGSRPQRAAVYVIDSDDATRAALRNLIAGAGHLPVLFSSAEQYLVARKDDCAACLILDLHLSGSNELSAQHDLFTADAPPKIFITSSSDVRASVRAMKAGAIDLLSKPFSDDDLLTAVEDAIQADVRARRRRSEMSELRRRYLHLTPRERDVFPFVTAGLLNKQTAAELGTSEVTVRVHRGQIMRKMRAQSLPDLVRMADRLQLN